MRLCKKKLRQPQEIKMKYDKMLKDAMQEKKPVRLFIGTKGMGVSTLLTYCLYLKYFLWKRDAH